MEPNIYYKITNENENHNGFQYKDGLNVLKEKFNDNPYHTCVRGGLYFTDLEHIINFLDYGCYLREIELPLNDPEFKIVKDPSGNKWRANKIILKNRYDLKNVDTFKLLIDRATHIPNYCYNLFNRAVSSGYLEIIKYLINNNEQNIKYDFSASLPFAAQNGYFEIVKYLMSISSINVETLNNSLALASAKNHLEIVKFFVTNGVDVNANNNIALQWASNNGYLNIVKYLIENGAGSENNISQSDILSRRLRNSLQLALRNGHDEVVKFLESEIIKRQNK